MNDEQQFNPVSEIGKEEVSSPQKNHKHNWLATTVVIVVVLLIAWGLLVFGPSPDGRGNLSFGEETVTETSPGEFLTTTEEGKVVSNFPLELVFDNQVLVTESYSILFDDRNDEQPVLSFIAEVDSADVLAAYQELFPDNGWSITNITTGTDSDDGQLTIYARTRGKQAGVTITPQEDGTTFVSVVYFEDKDTTNTDNTEVEE